MHGGDHSETLDAQSRAESAPCHAEFEETMNTAAKEISHDNHPHPLKKTTTASLSGYDGGYGCDICGKGGKGSVYHCNECGYDARGV